MTKNLVLMVSKSLPHSPLRIDHFERHDIPTFPAEFDADQHYRHTFGAVFVGVIQDAFGVVISELMWDGKPPERISKNAKDLPSGKSAVKHPK